MFSQPTATQRQIAHLRHHLYAGTEPTGGMLFFKAITQCRLDGTQASLARLNALFAQLRAKGVTLDSLLQKQGAKNFILTIALYLVDMIGKRIDDTPIWQNYNESQLAGAAPHEFPFSVVAQFAYGISLPCGAIFEAMTDDYDLAEYVATSADGILQKMHVNLLDEPSFITYQNLKKIRTGKLIDNTTAYHDELLKINFDYSLQSLIQIDKLVQYIKAKERLGFDDYEHFIGQQKNQALVYLLGCYVGATAVILAKSSAKWLNHKQIVQMTGDDNFIFALETNHAMMLGDHLALPFFAITNPLFDLADNLPKNAQHFAQTMMTKQAGHLQSLPMSATSNQTLPSSWQTALELAGQLAAWSMIHAIDGSVVAPMSLNYDETSKKITFVSHIDGDIDTLIERLKHDDSKPFGLLSYDVYANLGSGRYDSLALHVKVFDTPLDIEFFVPYRKADMPINQALGKAIFPVICNTKHNLEQLTALIQAFYQGVKNIKDPMTGTDLWTAYYVDKLDLYEPNPFVKNALPMAFDEKDSQITLFASEKTHQEGLSLSLQTPTHSQSVNEYFTHNAHFNHDDNTNHSNSYDHYKELLMQDKMNIMNRLENIEKDKGSNNLIFYIIGVLVMILLLKSCF